MKIKYVTGDLFEKLPHESSVSKHKIIAHVCNDVGAWGSGFVVPLGRKWPVAKEKYLEWAGYTSDPDVHPDKLIKLGKNQIICVEEHANMGSIYVANMVAQHGVVSPRNTRPINYAALGSIMFDIPKQFTYFEIHCPCFGAGLACGDWDVIEILIHDAWIRQGVPVTVYQLEGQEVREATEENTDGQTS